ncbi:hypothetical protein AMAG_06386 [Allomyces macrogynus ATCC 38327]|uniref:Uncharacterized protein n=1 Tax=Allomyces macrogynus (strain ATCC 38327) TaxID=578462 RepID=A0A0L0SGT5_ALLM3|nr:hypothetical protein AMAG_06386 [Allomyces macrogynus ATCC 38327]|eukprot:KNE61570.1 hypothetical protein AMAG_06386 [Allomyces macrogynus ATCC 38327]
MAPPFFAITDKVFAETQQNMIDREFGRATTIHGPGDAVWVQPPPNEMFQVRTLAMTMAHASEILTDYGASMDKMARIDALQQEFDATKQQKEAEKRELDATKQELDAATQRTDALVLQVQQLQNPLPDATGRFLVRPRHGDYIAKADDGRLGVADLSAFQQTMVSERVIMKELAEIRVQLHTTLPKLAPFPHQGKKAAVQVWIWNIKNMLHDANLDRLLDLEPVAWAALFLKLGINEELANA